MDKDKQAITEGDEILVIREKGLRALAKVRKELIALLARDDTPEEFKNIFEDMDEDVCFKK